MARPLRMEWEAGVYHVLNRGNYRTDIFRSAEAKAAFLKCLGKACQQTGWQVHDNPTPRSASSWACLHTTKPDPIRPTSARRWSRTLLAWLKVFLAGGWAPRTVASSVRRNRNASQTSLRLSA